LSEDKYSTFNTYEYGITYKEAEVKDDQSDTEVEKKQKRPGKCDARGVVCGEPPELYQRVGRA
jgi:hypothetical protein